MSSKERGFIVIARNLLDDPRYAPQGEFSHAEAWLWLLNAAVYADQQTVVKSGRHRVTVSLKRGQLTFATRFLAEKWKWSLRRVRNFLDSLRADNSITVETTAGQTLITIANYSVWQDRAARKGGSQTPSQTPSLNGSLNGSQSSADNTAKNSGAQHGSGSQNGSLSGSQTPSQTPSKKKELRKEDISGGGFTDWYSLYPRKKARRSAERAYRAALSRDVTHDALMAKTRVWAETWCQRLATEGREAIRFCPYPASWLNRGEYLDIAAAESLSAPPPPTFNADDWRRNLSFYRRRNEWSDSWGPKPGAPGCLVPPDILAEQGQHA